MYNANNYGYNPYGTYIPQTMQTTANTLQTAAVNNQNMQRTILNGKQVEGIDVVKYTEIPLDGSISYFPSTDGMSIFSKQIQNDGTSKIKTFKLVEDDIEKGMQYVTFDALKDELDRLREEIKKVDNNE